MVKYIFSHSVHRAATKWVKSFNQWHQIGMHIYRHAREHTNAVTHIQQQTHIKQICKVSIIGQNEHA